MTPVESLDIITHMDPNDTFDHFDTHIQSDELIPDGYEDSWDDDGDYPDFPEDSEIDGGFDADGYYGDPYEGCYDDCDHDPYEGCYDD